MVWATGQKLYGSRYVIERKLAQGGFGITYLAKNRQGKPVVIKTLNEEALTNPELYEYRDKYLRDFKREANWLAQCRHPHIVKIEDTFLEGSLPCILMEYIDGEDLRKRVKSRGALSPTEALRYIQQIGEALTVVHDKGLLHRDLKPDNIMVRSSLSEAVLIDFGIAREFVPNITQTQSVYVTLGFAPIEQYDQQAKRGAFTDVYALAATLYFLLTGKEPPPAFMRLVRDSLKPPQQINQSISDDVNQAILQGMALQPENRPQSVQQWLTLFPEQGKDEQIPVEFNESISNEVNEGIRKEIALQPDNRPQSLQNWLTRLLIRDKDEQVPVRYRKLEDFLAAEKWREADEETAKVMLQVAGREEEGWLTIKDIENFPCRDLGAIDQLWVTYTSERFGFSVQKRIWQSVGGIPGEYNYETYKQFGAQVGWYVKERTRAKDWIYRAYVWKCREDLTFTVEAPPGHLPVLICTAGVCSVGGFSSLASRLARCNISRF